MGDRANIKVTGQGDVFLYTHWEGSSLPFTLQNALKKADVVGRIDDPKYLARIIFQEMIEKHLNQLTGFGISGIVGDGEDRILTVSTENQSVTFPSGHTIPFEKYMKMNEVSWSTTGVE